MLPIFGRITKVYKANTVCSCFFSMKRIERKGCLADKKMYVTNNILFYCSIE